MSGFTFDELEDLDEGANDKPAPSGFDALEDLDASDARFKPWAQPGDAGSKRETSGSDTAGAPQWSGGSTLGDAAYSAAGGVFKGVGVNPRQAFGDEVGGRLQIANERSPVAAPIGNFIGEAAIQTAAAPARLAQAPVAMGALSGLLSGVGNSEGGAAEKARAGLGGAAAGAWLGKYTGEATGALSGLLERKVPQWADEQVSHGLMNRGATADDLARMDKTGGRQMFYDESNRLGIKGKPADVAPRAQQVVQDAEAKRAAIEASAPPIDPNALAARVRGANPYPGVDNLDAAAAKAASQAQRQAPNFDAVDTQRAYWGDKTNFASGTPEQSLQKGVHGAINSEMEDALSLASPGQGEAWRQAGRDEHVGIEMGNVATAAKDRARAQPIRPSDWLTFGALPMANKQRHAIAETGYGALKNLGQGGQQLGNLLEGAPAAMGGDIGGAYSADQSQQYTQTLTESALTSLQAGGQELGPWRDDIAQAASSPSPGALGVLLTRLAMTDSDFRQKLLPLLRGQR